MSIWISLKTLRSTYVIFNTFWSRYASFQSHSTINSSCFAQHTSLSKGCRRWRLLNFQNQCTVPVGCQLATMETPIVRSFWRQSNTVVSLSSIRTDPKQMNEHTAFSQEWASVHSSTENFIWVTIKIVSQCHNMTMKQPIQKRHKSSRTSPLTLG